MADYPQIDLNTWHPTGQGGNGTTYENPERPDVILKVNKPGLNTFDAVKKEFDVSMAVDALGISVPKMLEMVRVGGACATISERIKEKKSLSRICHDQPERIEEMARLMCVKGRELFSKTCNTDFFPSRKEQLLRAVEKVQFIGKKNKAVLSAFANTIRDVKTCIHGDFNTGNLILAGDKCYWIDLDRFGYGDPMFDIGHLYQICNTYASMKRVQDLFHMTEAQLRLFWDAFAKEYTGKEDHSEFDTLAGKFACLDVIVRTYFVKPTFLEKLFFGMYVRKLVKQYYD